MARLARGYTQDQLAAITGLARCTVNRYENEHFRARIDTAFILADALGISLESLRQAPWTFADLFPRYVSSGR